MKKILLSLFVGLFGFISFCSADTVILSGENINTNIYITARNFEFGNNDFTINCTFTPDNNSYGYIGGELKTVSPDMSLGTSTYPDTYFDWTEPYSLTLNGKRQRPGGAYYYYSFLYIQLKIQQFVGTYHYTCTLQGTAIKGASACPVCPTCPTCDDPYTSLECQEEYNLIPLSSVDQTYCENNNLCPVYTGEISTGLSTLYINNIRHESMPFIYVNIPEEFNRDYSTGINDFTINVSGYNVDTDYIAGIITTQNTKPNNVDLNNIIQVIIPLFVPGLVVILFIYFVFRFLKKLF